MNQRVAPSLVTHITPNKKDVLDRELRPILQEWYNGPEDIMLTSIYGIRCYLRLVYVLLTSYFRHISSYLCLIFVVFSVCFVLRKHCFICMLFCDACYDVRCYAMMCDVML